MKKPGPRIFGGLLVAMLIATIGAVLVSAETENAGETEEWHLPFHGRGNSFGQKSLDNELIGFLILKFGIFLPHTKRFCRIKE